MPCSVKLFPLGLEELGRIKLEDPQLLDIIQKLERKEPCGPYVLSRGVLHCPARNDGRQKVLVPMVFAYFDWRPPRCLQDDK